MQLRRRDRERVEERHTLAEQLERIERELLHMSAFVRQHNGGVGLRLEAATGTSGTSGSEELGDGDQRTYVSCPTPVSTQESWSHPTPPPSTHTVAFVSASPPRRTDSFSTQTNPSFLSVPASSPPILAQVTNIQLMGSLSDLRRTMDRFIRRQQITNDMLEDLRGRIPVHQMERLGVSRLANYTEVLSHISQSLRTVPDQLRTSSGNALVEVSASSQSPIALDVPTDVNVPQATPQENSTSSSPLPEPPSIRVPSLTSPPSASGAGYLHTHAPNELLQQPSIWQSRKRRVVPRRRVFSEPSSPASQKMDSRELRGREREQALGDSGTSSIASHRPSILRCRSPDRWPLGGAQHETSDKPNVLTIARPMVCCV